MKNKRVYYFVEGECEKELVDSLKLNPSLIIPGKSKVFNPITKRLTPNDFVTILPNSIIIFIFDTDTNDINILEHNLKMIRKYLSKTEVVLIPQVKNFEDELKRSLKIKNIFELTNSRSLSNFKRDFIKMNNIRNAFEKYNFDINKLWILSPDGEFSKYKQESYKIKINK